MVQLRFTKLIGKVLDKSKRQTIRKPRKNPIREWDRLQVYVLMKVGDANVQKIARKKLKDLTEEEALKDGFDSLEECQQAIMDMHQCDLEEEFDIIEFLPWWEPMKLVVLDDIVSRGINSIMDEMWKAAEKGLMEKKAEESN